MSYLPPVNAKASPPAKLVDDLDGAPPGAFEFYDYGRADMQDAGILLNCPCGCGVHTAMPFRRVRPDDGRPVWSWDGNRESPTCTPSLLIYQVAPDGRITGEHWHGFLTNGEWRSC